MKYLLAILLALSGCGTEENTSPSPASMRKGQHSTDVSTVITNTSNYELTAEDKQDIRFMWEEEKLARDVYTTLYDRWGSRVFSNISRSEQRHMDAIGQLLTKYDIEKPSDASQASVFGIPEVQNLYDDLTSRGLDSEASAFAIGIEIEKLDIQDLKERLEASHEDARVIYESLLEGSYNHLAAFERQVKQ